MRTFSLLLVIVLLLSTLRSEGQSSIFNRVHPPEGTTFLHITGIVQDQNGYMWFASKKGLYRHDGYNMISYKNNPLIPNSIASNSLESICLDSAGILWIGTYGSGLDRFDPATETFQHFQHDPKNSESLSNDTVTALLNDAKGNTWIGTPGGLNRFDSKTGKFTRYQHLPADANSLSSNEVRALYQDRKGILWIGTGNPYDRDAAEARDGGLNKFDERTQKFHRYGHEPGNPRSLVNNKVGAIFEDSKGIFWVGTGGDGLHKMDRQNGTFERLQYNPKNPRKLSRPPLNKGYLHDHISFIIEDAASIIWIGTSDGGMNRYDPQTNNISYHKFENIGRNQAVGDEDSTTWSAYNSRDGMLWISTVLGNLFRVDPFNRNLPFVSLGVPVHAFHKDQAGTLWLATQEGLVWSDSLMNDKPLPQMLRLPGPAKNLLFRMLPGRDRNIWIGSDAGLYNFDTEKKTSTRYIHDAKDTKSLSDDFVTSLYQDAKANLWVGNFRGLNLLNVTTSEFTNYQVAPKDTHRYSINMVSSIIEDRQGKLWVGSPAGGGIYHFETTKKSFKNYIAGVAVRCVYLDADDVLWVGADDGLYRYNRSSDIFVRYTDPSSSMEIHNVVSIIEDDDKNLWIGTARGIIQINRQRNETKLYGKNYNLGQTDLTFGAYKDQFGTLYFGSATGYYKFHPAQLSSKSKAPHIILSAFHIANKLVKPGENSPLEKPLSQLSEILLSHDQNVFSLDFVAIDYTNPADNRYLFMLENYDNSWHQAGLDRKANYYNVPPGKYHFKVRAANSEGVWSEKTLALVITPPWWKTWWAYLVYALLIVALAYGIYRLQRNRILAKEQEKARQLELAHAKEIEKAYYELSTTQAQLIQREKMASLGELTAGIAHEIQNPLNFVNNFSEVNRDLLAEMKNEIELGNIKLAKDIANDVIENENKINHHGKRADAIVKGMLQHSQASAGAKVETDVNKLADEYLQLAYHGLRGKDKSFYATLKTAYDEQVGNVSLIPQDIGRVLLNLLNNAFYAVKEKKQVQSTGYEPTVFVGTKRIDNKLRLIVKDNGNGIPQGVLSKIFQPFFTTKPTGQGTGLGLSLSYDIVKAHGGEIKVNSSPGEFTEFIVELPV